MATPDWLQKYHHRQHDGLNMLLIIVSQICFWTKCFWLQNHCPVEKEPQATTLSYFPRAITTQSVGHSGSFLSFVTNKACKITWGDVCYVRVSVRWYYRIWKRSWDKTGWAVLSSYRGKTRSTSPKNLLPYLTVVATCSNSLLQREAFNVYSQA